MLAPRHQVLTGRIRVNKKNYEDCYVSGKPRFNRDVNIMSFAARNRALDQDVVAVELLPRELWRYLDEEALVWRENQTTHAHTAC